jgi:LCP family protein required for cell wall assembly
MYYLRRAIFIVLIAALLSGCAAPLASGQAIAELTAPDLQPTFVVADPNAQPTPTPFQPLAPTAVLQSTEMAAIGTPAPEITAMPTPAITLPAEGLPGENPLTNLPKQINVLLLGSDRRPGDGGFRTDTIILVTLNAELGKVNITSFPRDLYITIPGRGMGRINTAWTYGGHDLLVQTMKHNFGLEIDHYVLINFSSFKQIVDGLGGLDVVVEEPVSDYYNGRWTSIPAGPIHMNADTVLWYVRTRKTTNDFARNRRQQEIIQALFEKMLSLDAIKRAPEFYTLYKSNVNTDVGLMDVLTWLPLAAKIADTRNIKQYYIGPKIVSDWITPEGAMVLLPNRELVMQVIRKSQNLP